MMYDPEDDFEGGLLHRGNLRWWQWPIAIVVGLWRLAHGKGDFS